MINLDYNRSDLARKTGLSRVTITNILNGKQKNPKSETLKKIAQVLNCTVDDLIKDNKESSN